LAQGLWRGFIKICKKGGFKMVNLVFNNELNGIELYFDKKPLQDIIDSLKNAGFRWHKLKKCWYAKQSEKTLKIAQSITGKQAETITEAKSSMSYFPLYDHVDGSKILQDSNIELDAYNSYYFADINAYIHFYRDSAVIIDLTDALKAGKTCKRYYIEHKEWKNEGIWCDLVNNGIRTFTELYNRAITGLNIDTLRVTITEEKAINTFSPFVEIKPIKKPEKWTIAHVWKAILAGQIYKGVKDGYYTDDYAHDAAVNFKTGSRIHLPSLAKQVIEHPSGWRVYVDKEENGIIQLSFNCYSFDCNTLYFDENCNIKEAEQRRIKEAEELENYNNSLLSQIIPIAPEEVKENALYNIIHLKMDDNSKKYNKVSELLTGLELFWQDEIYIGEDTEPTIEYQIRYKIISIEEYPIIDDKLYTISNFYNRPYFEDDRRFINMGNWETIITGKALKEVLQNGQKFPLIQESKYTFEQAITTIKNHITGKMIWCVGACDTDYQESFKRIMREINRLNVNVIAL
jgi:hypothetical protein